MALLSGAIVYESASATRRGWADAYGCYEGEATEAVMPPPPLGRMGRRLQEIYDTPVEQRPLDLYAALAEVAR